MFAKLFTLFVLVAVAFAAPNPNPKPQFFAGPDYVSSAAVVPSYVSPYSYEYAAAPVAYSGYPAGALYYR